MKQVTRNSIIAAWAAAMLTKMGRPIDVDIVVDINEAFVVVSIKSLDIVDFASRKQLYIADKWVISV